MYKVFFNNNIIFFSSQPISEDHLANGLYIRCENDVDFNYLIAKLSDPERKINFHIISDDVDNCFNNFCSSFKIIEAAGGVIFNEKDEFLGIFRRERWDLPKGKLDDNETIEQAAIRECSEETGLQSLELHEKLIETYHTYSEKNERILKRTYWYKILNTRNEEIKPQLEEDITEVCWFKEIPDSFRNNTFPSILDVLKTVKR